MYCLLIPGSYLSQEEVCSLTYRRSHTVLCGDSRTNHADFYITLPSIQPIKINCILEKKGMQLSARDSAGLQTVRPPLGCAPWLTSLCPTLAHETSDPTNHSHFPNSAVCTLVQVDTTITGHRQCLMFKPRSPLVSRVVIGAVAS
jgi:hypothetical protein